MATIGYFIRSKTDTSTIYCRLTLDRKRRFEKKTDLTIKVKNWSIEKKYPINPKSNEGAQRKANLKRLREKLDGLKTHIQNKVNISISEGEQINTKWLGHQINVFFGQASETGKDDTVIGAFDRYIKYLQEREYPNSNTIRMYRYSKKKFKQFQGKDNYRIKDIDGFFADEFSPEKINLGKSTTKKVLRNLITVCKHSHKKYGLEISPTLHGIETPRAVKQHKIHLEPKELIQIEKANIVSDYLQNARKWLLLACEVGVRISDTKHINENNIVEYDGMQFIQFMPTKQRKGKDKIFVTIPVVGKIKKLLKDGFPRSISHPKLNEYVKKVCEIAEINEPTQGKRRIEKNGLHVEGIYPKWQLVTFHCARYSFITNSKNIINNQMVRTITGHQSDQMLENYQLQEHFKDAKIVGEILQKNYEERTAPMAVNE